MSTPEPKRFPRAIALAVAEELGAWLAPLCEGGMPAPSDNGPAPRAVALAWLRVVGSTRRGKPLVKDLELLFIPLRAAAPRDLLGAIAGDGPSLVWQHLDGLVAAGTLTKRAKCDGTFTWGEDIRLAVHTASGLPVDFFAARRANWWNQLVCRTGGKLTNEAICTAAIARGLKWATTSAGFANRRTGAHARTVHSERDVFTIAGLEYREPRDRE